MSQDGQNTIADSSAGLEPISDNVSQMQNDPLMVIVLFAVSIYVAKLWLDDYRAAQRGAPNRRAFPGAVACKGLAIWVAVAGALLLLAIETGGEYALGIAAEQSDITVIVLLAWVSAAFIEELIFRGYLVVAARGRAALVASIMGFSLIFTLLHPFFWELEYPEGVASWQFWQAEWVVDFGLKAWFSSALVFANSLWFYAVRFYRLNPAHSLLPCIAAHLASNLGVFVIKLLQGHVVAWW